MDSPSVYLPMDRRQAMARGSALPDRALGSALFADITGFTTLTDELVRRYGTQRGAEETTAALNHVYGALVAEVDRYHGSVIGFSGDAITCWFDEDEGSLAVAAGFAMRRAMSGLVDRSGSRSVATPLAIKVTIGVGPVRRLVVGDPSIQVYEVIAGRTVERLAAAAEHTRGGEVVMAAAAPRDFDGLRLGDSWQPIDGGVFTPVIEAVAVGPKPWPDLTADVVADAAARPWLPASVFDHISASGSGAGTEFLAELRPCVSVFVRFGGIDLEADSAGDRLDAFVRRCQAIVARWDGILVDVTVGDKGSYLSVLFGAPTEHEDDPQRAAAAALEMRSVPDEPTAISSIQIGMARGRVCVGSFGGPTRRAYGVQGREVNVAARLMELAAHGDIIVSERVARAVADGFDLRPRGVVAVKGIADPIVTFALDRAVAPRVAIDRRSTRRANSGTLVGRSAEMSLLADDLDAVEQGAGRCVVVRGEPGVGKSRLVHAVLDDARRRGMRIFTAAGDTVDRTTPFAVWRPIFGALFASGSSRVGLEAILAPLDDRLRDEVSGQAALLGAVLPVAPSENDRTRGMSPDARHENTVRLLAQLLEAHRGPAPIVLAIDDAQWIDSASWSLLRRVVGETDGALVVLAARSQGEKTPDLDALEALPLARTIELGSLDTADSLTLVRQALEVESLPDSVARFVTARAGGHPFYSLELAYALRDAGLLEVAEGRARLASGADLERLEFPESIEGVIASRLDRLPPDARTTLKVASILGDPFSASVVAELLESGSAGELADRLDVLEALDLIALSTADVAGGYSFRHVLIRDVVYGRLLFAQRRQLHRLAAEHFERVDAAAGGVPDGLLAHHWEAAGVPGRAIDHLEVAGADALRDGAFVESAAFLGRAISLADPVAQAAAAEPAAERVEVTPLRSAGWRWLAAQASYRLGDLDLSRDLAEAALAVIDRPVPRDGIRVTGATAVEAGTQVLHRSMPGRFLDRAPEADRERMRRAVRAYLNLAEVYYLASRKGRSAYAAMRALNVAERAGPSLDLVETYGAICIIGGLIGRHRIAERYGQLGRDAAEVIGQPYATAINLHQVCLYRSGTGPPDKLFADYETAVELFRSLGDKGRFRDCIGLAGIAAYLFGRHDVARGYLTELLETHAEGERSLPWTWGVTWLAAIALREGRTDEAVDGLRRGVASQVSERLDLTSISLHGLLALALWRAGRPDEARMEADVTRSLIGATGGRPTGHPVLDGYAALAELSLEWWDDATSPGERVVWRRRAEESSRFLGAYRKVFPIGEPAYRLHAGALAARLGRASDAEREWKRSLAAAEALDMRHDIERVRLALGEADPKDAEGSAGPEESQMAGAARASTDVEREGRTR